MVTPEQLPIEEHAQQIDLERALQIEAELKHDLMAELKTYAEQCSIGGGIIHLGATSTDIEDNADALRVRESLDRIVTAVRTLLTSLAGQIEKYAELPAMAFTHLRQPERWLSPGTGRAGSADRLRGTEARARGAER
jgi:adenylosuccinate lyase